MFDDNHWNDGKRPTSLNVRNELFREFSKSLILGPPDWLPKSSPTETEHQIFVLPAVSLGSIPALSIPFDKATPAYADATTLVNFYVEDRKLRRLFNNPGVFVRAFEKYWGITSPDFSIWNNAPECLRIAATWYNRALGRFFSDKGLHVIPQVRWVSPLDYKHCFAGITAGSVVAASNNGCWHDYELRNNFLLGLRELVQRVDPEAIFIHGRMDETIRRQIGPDCEIIHFPTRQSVEIGMR